MGSRSDETAREVLSFVADNQTTMTVLADDGPLSLDAIAAQTERAKSTANRTVNSLADAGLVEVRDEDKQYRYSLTFHGRQVVDWLREGTDRFADRRMYDAVPPTASLPRWIVDEGSVTVVSEDESAKHEVFDPILNFISRADRFHVVAPALTRDSTFYRLADEVVSHEMAVEMTIPESFLNLLTERFPDEMSQMVRDYDVRAFALPDDDPLPYGFGLGYHEAEDGTVQDAELALVCYDDQYHNANGTVINDTPWAVTWGERRYDDYRSMANERTAAIE